MVDGAISVFNVENGMVASTNPVWLQTAFDTLMGLFDRVGLRTNIRKTVGMVCQPRRALYWGGSHFERRQSAF